MEANLELESVRKPRTFLTTEREASLVEAILAIDEAAIPLASTEDGFVAVGYFVPIGPLHKALGVVGHSAPHNPNIDHQPPAWWMQLLRRAVERTEAVAL